MINQRELELFFTSIEKCNYLVLRGYEDLLDSINNGEDIDLLVGNIDDFVLQTSARRVSIKEDCYNYAVNIGENTALIDLRVVGDDYYDSKWEIDMLTNKIRYGNIYVMNKEAYRFSIYYHCLLHKNRIPEKYIAFILQNGISNIGQLKRDLDHYMVMNGYKYVKPKDADVQFNTRMFYSRKIHYLLLRMKKALHKKTVFD